MDKQGIQILNRAKKAAGVKYNRELADLLGVKEQNISAWKRDGWPDAQIYRTAHLIACRPEWLRTGEGPIHEPWRAEWAKEDQQEYLTVDIASQAMEELDSFLERRGMTPSPKMKRKLYEGLIEEYLERDRQVDMADILKEMTGN